MVQRFKEAGHPVFKTTSASSCGILKQKKGRCTIHFKGDSMNTELLLQTIHSVNHLSVCGAVANWCYQFGLTEEEKGRVGIPVDNEISTMVEPEEVELLVSPPTQAPGNRMQGSSLSFKTLEKKIQLTQLCEKAFFQHLVITRNSYKIRPNADDGWSSHDVTRSIMTRLALVWGFLSLRA